MVNSSGASALHLACKRGNHHAVTILLRCQNIYVCMKDKSKDTPLHEACANGHATIVDELMQHLIKKYPISMVVKVILKNKNKDLQTPLHLACKKGCDVVVHNIVKHFGESSLRVLMEVEGKKRKTPLHLACEGRHVKVIHKLLSNYTNVSAPGEYEGTCLHTAAKYGYTDVAKSLCLAQNIVIDALDEDDQTPLHYAANYDRVEMIDFLISRYILLCMVLYCPVKCIVKSNL